MRLGRELLDWLNEVCPPATAMAPVVLTLWVAQKKRRSIPGGGIVGRLHKDGGHAGTERRGRDLGHRADKVSIGLADRACGRWVQIDMCQNVNICSAQLALPGAL